MIRRTNTDRIRELLRSQPDLDDDTISDLTGVSPRQQVNQICRRLEADGVLLRFRGSAGKIVNRLVEGSSLSYVQNCPPHPRSEASSTGRFQGLVPRDLRSTLILLPCSGTKHPSLGRRSEGPGILDDLPPGLAAELRAARAAVRERARVDEDTLLPAWRRYDGTLYRTARQALGRAVAAHQKILILSGGYGVVLATEPIGTYEAVFRSSWWPRGLLERVLEAYAMRQEVSAVRAFASASTAYRGIIERSNWRANTKDAVLLMPARVGGGAMVKAPRAQGEALTALLDGTLGKAWLSSDGIGLEAVELCGKGGA